MSSQKQLAKKCQNPEVLFSNPAFSYSIYFGESQWDSGCYRFLNSKHKIKLFMQVTTDKKDNFCDY